MSQKKKNTYVITNKVLGDLKLFGMCQFTPMPVVKINGQVQNSTGFIRCIEFPNPATTRMIIEIERLKTIMGEKLACTIVEYLDKDTMQPVAYLFPTNEIMYQGKEDEFMQRLNHASRRDFIRQKEIRDKYLEKIKIR